MRADREAIEKTGGKASRAEFDAVLSAIEKASMATIVDVGANTSVTFLKVVSEVAPLLASEGVEFGVCVVVTNEPGALADAPNLLALAKTVGQGSLPDRKSLAWRGAPKLVKEND